MFLVTNYLKFYLYSLQLLLLILFEDKKKVK